MPVNYFRKSKSLFSTTSNSFGSGLAVTITPNSVAGLPTDTQIVLTFDRVDTAGAATTGNKVERILGQISGSNFVPIERGVDGTTDQAHTSPVAEVIWNGRDISDLAVGMLVEHAQDGTHDAAVITKMASTDVHSAGWVVNENDMASNTANKVPSQASVKAYADLRSKSPQVATITDAATITPTAGSVGNYTVTALGQAATIAAPSGTPVDGQKLVLRIKDNGTARALTFNSIYRAMGTPIPTTTILSKTLYLGFIYNSADSKWDLVAAAQET